jgi:alkaline phosphatase
MLRLIIACVTVGLASMAAAGMGSQKPLPATSKQPATASPAGPHDPVLAPLPRSAAAGPKNVILFIGDGMGFGQVTSTRIKSLGPDGRLRLERLPVTGVVVNHSANSLIPDSAACGTALACGVKTNNGMLGQTRERRYQSILEACQAAGYRTGLVVTKNLTDATPAAFASHVTSRKMEPAIARQLLASGVNVLLGGGRRYFLPRAFSPDAGDPNNLAALIRGNGYVWVLGEAQLQCVDADRVLGLFAYEAMKSLPGEPNLTIMTENAIRLLTRAGVGQGFFLMVEGSQIDSACHNNDPNQMFREVLAFDEAVHAGIDFARPDGHTLVIVTADHETGGLEIVVPKASAKAKTTLTKAVDPNEDDYQDPSAMVLHLKWTGKDHTGLPVPLYAFGPGCLEFTGVIDNTEVPLRIARLLHIRGFPRTLGR